MNESEYMQWTKEYELGNSKIDQQHHRLVEIINELHQVILRPNPKKYISGILDQLFEYNEIHFKTEENCFDAFAYDQKDIHLAKHAEFVKKLNKYRKKNETGIITGSIVMLEYLKNWLIEHILEVDKDFVTQATKAGIEIH